MRTANGVVKPGEHFGILMFDIARACDWFPALPGV